MRELTDMVQPELVFDGTPRGEEPAMKIQWEASVEEPSGGNAGGEHKSLVV